MIRSIQAGKIIGVKTSFFTIMNPEKYDPQAIPSAWQEFFSLYRDSNLPKSNTFYGAAIPNNSMDTPMQYFAGILAEASLETPNGFVEVTLPEGDYFTFTHQGPISNLGESYGRAYGVELPASGREMRGAPHLEIYESEKDPMANDYEMVIAIPVI